MQKKRKPTKSRPTPNLDKLDHLEVTYISTDMLEHSRDKFHDNNKFEKRSRGNDFYKNVRDSIAKHGMINPIIVFPNKDIKTGKYRIGIGNNRWLAAKELGIKEVPVHFGEYNRYELYDIKKFFKPVE